MATSILPGTTRSGGHARTYKLGAGLRMRGATSGRVGILPPATITDYDLTLPGSLAASNKLLQVSSAGVVSLVDPVTIGGTGTELLYRGGASSAAAVAGSSWNGTTLTLPNATLSPSSGNSVITLKTLLDTALITLGSGTRDLRIGFADISGIRAGQTFLHIYFEDTTILGVSASVISLRKPAYAGNGVTSATPAAGYLYGTGGSGTDVVGGTLYIAPGPSTGNASPSSVVVQSTVAGTSGSTAQTLVDTLTVANGLTEAKDTIRIRSAVNQKTAVIFASNLDRAKIEFDAAIQSLSIFINSASTYRIGITNTGSVALGIGLASIAAKLHAVSTSTQLRVGYDVANYADLLVSSAGNLTITPSGGVMSVTGDVRPATDDTYYLGKNDDDSPSAWKGVILRDTTNGKYYRLEIVSGVVTATDLTD